MSGTRVPPTVSLVPKTSGLAVFPVPVCLICTHFIDFKVSFVYHYIFKYSFYDDKSLKKTFKKIKKNKYFSFCFYFKQFIYINLMHLNSSNDLNNNQQLNYINVTLWFYTYKI